jgi:hypothetical protein
MSSKCCHPTGPARQPGLMPASHAQEIIPANLGLTSQHFGKRKEMTVWYEASFGEGKNQLASPVPIKQSRLWLELETLYHRPFVSIVR